MRGMSMRRMSHSTIDRCSLPVLRTACSCASSIKKTPLDHALPYERSAPASSGPVGGASDVEGCGDRRCW